MLQGFVCALGLIKSYLRVARDVIRVCVVLGNQMRSAATMCISAHTVARSYCLFRQGSCTGEKTIGDRQIHQCSTTCRPEGGRNDFTVGILTLGRCLWERFPSSQHILDDGKFLATNRTWSKNRLNTRVTVQTPSQKSPFCTPAFTIFKHRKH